MTGQEGRLAHKTQQAARLMESQLNSWPVIILRLSKHGPLLGEGISQSPVSGDDVIWA